MEKNHSMKHVFRNCPLKQSLWKQSLHSIQNLIPVTVVKTESRAWVPVFEECTTRPLGPIPILRHEACSQRL